MTTIKFTGHSDDLCQRWKKPEAMMPIDEIFLKFFSDLLCQTNGGVIEMTVEPQVYDMLERIVRFNVARNTYAPPPPPPRHLSFVTGPGSRDVTIKRGPDKCHACGCEKHHP